jgi:hypothetical protein
MAVPRWIPHWRQEDHRGELTLVASETSLVSILILNWTRSKNWMKTENENEVRDEWEAKTDTKFAPLPVSRRWALVPSYVFKRDSLI